MRKRVYELFVVLLVCMLHGACGGGGSTTTRTTQAQTPISLSLAPSSANVRLGTTQQFTASVTGSVNTTVNWSVNGVAGGNSTAGTINASGLYTPPAAIPGSGAITVTATLAANASTTGSATVTLLNPTPQILSAISAQVTPGTYTLSVAGTGFVSGSVITVDGQPVTTTAASATRLSATVNVNSGRTQSNTVAVENPAPGASTSNAVAVNITRAAIDANLTAAARFLEQATFGYTRADVQRVAQIGPATWINEQFDIAPSQWPNIPIDVVGSDGTVGFPQHCRNAGLTCAQMVFYQNALTGSDQLRQRVAWALQQIWVVSAVTVNRGDAHMYYMRTMNSLAFDNYLNIMKRVTLSPGMGWFQDIANNDGTENTLPNENYARELLQLFTIGTVMLNEDGSLQVDSNGMQISTYPESVVQNFARVNTGWTFRARSGVTQIWNQRPNNNVDWNADMVPIEAQHDRGQKTVLGGAVLPANQDAAPELDQALRIIFDHPNVGPFVSRMLIQRLVTSNPSPQYIARVAAKFRDNGQGVRGDMKAVIKAILLDEEARRGDTSPLPLSAMADGKLKEPVLYVTGTLRALGAVPVAASPAVPSNTNTFALALASAGSTPPYAAAMSQNVLFSPTVFNFYSPDYVIPGTAKFGPEFQLHTTATTTLRSNFADAAVRNSVGGGTTVSAALNAYSALAAHPDHLVERLNQDFMRGQMGDAMRRRIVEAVSAVAGSASTSRVRTALYLVITSPQYQAQP